MTLYTLTAEVDQPLELSVFQILEIKYRAGIYIAC